MSIKPPPKRGSLSFFLIIVQFPEKNNDTQDQKHVKEDIPYIGAFPEAVREVSAFESRGAHDCATEIEKEHKRIDRIPDIEKDVVLSSSLFEEIKHCVQYRNRHTEHSDHHEPVPKQRGKELRICVHHERPETPEKHEEHIEDKRPVQTLPLALIETEYGKNDI